MSGLSLKSERMLSCASNYPIGSLEWQPPMLATLSHEYFSHPEWIFECKFDGQRCLAYCDLNGKISLYSRNKKILNDVYPELVIALKQSSHKTFILDGEIITLDHKGVSSFTRLQKRISLTKATESGIKEAPVYFYIFDIQYFDGCDLRQLPLIERKVILRKVIHFNEKILLTDYIKEQGAKFYEDAKKKGWEGIMAKRANSIYTNKRSVDWLKFKCSNGQEFIILGYTEPKGSRVGFGALLIGYYKGDKLCYAGKVGTGFDRALLLDLKQQFISLESSSLPGKQDAKGRVHWLEPKLVCEVRFSEWTKNGKLRHPRYVGLRIDKDAKDIVRE